MSEAKSDIPGDSPPLIQDFSDTVSRDIEPTCELGSTHARVLQFLCQVLTGVNCLIRHTLLPMVINNLHI